VTFTACAWPQISINISSGGDNAEEEPFGDVDASCIFMSACSAMELYPKVPAVDNFECNYLSAPDAYQSDPSTDSSNKNKDSVCKACRKALKALEDDSETCGSPFAVKDEPYSYLSNSFPTPSADPCTCPIRSAWMCGKRTRYVDADFGMCREQKQLTIGAAIGHFGRWSRWSLCGR
jgi:hypothetical protein